MGKVAVIADTTSQISTEIAEKYDIRLVSLYVHINGESFRESEIDISWFCNNIPRWKEENRAITTSAPSVGDFLDAYRELREKAEAVLAVCLSSKFSATFAAALEAKKIAENETPQIPLEIVDTATVCGAQMLVALEASRAASAGKGLADLVDYANRIVKKVNYINLSSDVSYLAKCGRIHHARSFADSKIASTLLMESSMATGGEHKPIGRYRTRKQALEKLLEIVRERSKDKKLHVVINHADSPGEAKQLKENISKDFQCLEVFICQSLPLVTYHEGLGNLKLSWWSED
jgi:DegV family protein with EDD domain